MAKNRAKKLFVVVALIATIVPALFTLEKAGGIENWQGVPPHGITDSLYYYARIHEVADGYPLVGNPYLYEYKNEYSPSFFLPDIISAIPLYAGFSFNVAIVLNVFVWSFIFLLLAYRLLSHLKISEHWAILWSLFLYLGSYAFMLRPTVMQIIFPLYLFFLVTLICYLYEPLSKKRALWLAGASATTFYFYNFLALIVFLTLFFILCWFLFSKQFKELRALVFVGVYSTILLIPFAIYSLIQSSGPLYADTISRLGLVYTRIPAIEAFFFGRWIVIGLGAFALLWFFLPRKESGYIPRRIFWVSTGCALFVGLFMNVLTGIEITLAIHIGRFVILWMLLLLGVLLYEWYFSCSSRSRKITLSAHVVIGILVLLLSVGTARNIPRALSFFEFNNRGYPIAELQAYGGPLDWLENNVPDESVIWSNNSIGSYIPVMTKHYILFHNGAVLHTISDRELEERYLLWRSFEDVTIDDMKQEFGFYAGAGRSKEQPLAHNRRVWLCNNLTKFIDMRECSQKTDAVALQGEQYFETLVEQFESVKENQVDLLTKYNVKYLIIDTLYDNFNVEESTSSAVYADGRFLVFRIEDILKEPEEQF